MEILLLHLFYHKRLIHIDDRFIHLINIPLKGDREIIINSSWRILHDPDTLASCTFTFQNKQCYLTLRRRYFTMFIPVSLSTSAAFSKGTIFNFDFDNAFSAIFALSPASSMSFCALLYFVKFNAASSSASSTCCL